MGTAKSPVLIWVALCGEHELSRHGLATMLTTADASGSWTGLTPTSARLASSRRPDVGQLDLEVARGTAEETLRRMLALPQPPTSRKSKQLTLPLHRKSLGGSVRPQPYWPTSRGL
jgi:hypothetical protein